MNIYEKISAVRTEILKRSLSKDKKAFNYHYIDLPQIEPIITEECAKVGILTVVDFPQGLAVMRVFDLEAPLSETPVLTISVPCDYRLVEIKGSQPIQNVGGMMTYMRRYLYMQLFAISEHDAVEGIGWAEREAEAEKSQNAQAQNEEPPKDIVSDKVSDIDDAHRKDVINALEHRFPNYISKLVAYKGVDSVDQLTTDYIEKAFAKMCGEQPKKEETTDGNLF